MTRVVDASAIGALVFGEPHKPWVETQIADAKLIAPPLLTFELGNICWKKLRQYPNDATIILAAWDTWSASHLVTAQPGDPIATIRLAQRHSLTFYDASYLWLADRHRLVLVSLDTRLVRAARSLGLDAPSPGDAVQTTPRSRN